MAALHCHDHGRILAVVEELSERRARVREGPLLSRGVLKREHMLAQGSTGGKINEHKVVIKCCCERTGFQEGSEVSGGGG